METPSIVEFSLTNPQHHSIAASIWNAACGSDFAITPHFVEFNALPSAGVERMGKLAMLAGQPVGFVIASLRTDTPDREGWIDAVAVDPSRQHKGIGRALLDWAHGWLDQSNCSYVELGGSFRPFTPGLPLQLSPDPFLSLGYQQLDVTWDMAHALQGYTSRFPNPTPPAEVCPMQPGQEGELLALMEREFPGRWHFDAVEFVRDGRRLSDWLLLWIEGRLQGFCCITLEDSESPLERYYPHRLPRPWGQVGTYGVANSLRGRGYGLYLIDSSLVHLRDLGVNGCVIDWTAFLDLYGKFGFRPYNQFRVFRKNLK